MRKVRGIALQGFFLSVVILLTGCSVSNPDNPLSAPATVIAGEEFSIEAQQGFAIVATKVVAARNRDEGWVLVAKSDDEEPTAYPADSMTVLTLALEGPFQSLTFRFDPQTIPDSYSVCLPLSKEESSPSEEFCKSIQVVAPKK